MKPPAAICRGRSLQGRDFFRLRLFAAAAGVKQIAQPAFLAYAVRDGEYDGQIAAVEDVAENTALRAEQDEQQDKDPQTIVAAEISETVH